MSEAIEETRRRREIQESYNREHGITPQGIKKAIRDITERIKATSKEEPYASRPVTKEDTIRLIKKLELEMKKAAKNLDFEQAALIRDRIADMRKNLDYILDRDLIEKAKEV
jgi:excinuclease ABC subunit B